MDGPAGLLLAIVLPLIGMYLLYWVVRYAVRDGIRDAARHRGRERSASE